MALKEYSSECEKYQKRITCKDKHNPQTYIAHNKDLNEVYKYRIDGDVVQDGERCDYLVWNETKKNVYFIELKGSDLIKAVRQIEETERVLKSRFEKEFKLVKAYYRVVLNKTCTHALDNNKVRRFKINHPGQCEFKTVKFEEDI